MSSILRLLSLELDRIELPSMWRTTLWLALKGLKGGGHLAGRATRAQRDGSQAGFVRLGALDQGTGPHVVRAHSLVVVAWAEEATAEGSNVHHLGGAHDCSHAYITRFTMG
jgi:hypothetical protein